MSGSKFIAVMAALIGIVAICVLGIYLYQRDAGPPQTAEEGTPPGAAPGQPKTEDQAPTAVPSFDVVRVEKSGDGVIAGRAHPGWSVSVASGNTVVAETSADEEGAWTVVLEKPLAPGDHELTVTATSPDGTSSLSSQETVKVAVAETESGGNDIAALPEAIKPTEPEDDNAVPAAPQDDVSAADENAAKSTSDADAADQTAAASDGEIPGDRSLIENPYERAASEPAEDSGAEDSGAEDSGQAEQPSQMAEADIPGDKSLMQPSTQTPASEPAAAEAASDTPGDKSLIQPSTQTPASEPAAAEAPSDAAVDETSPPAEADDQSAAQPGEVPGDKSLVERSASDPALPEATPEGQHNAKPPVVFKTVDYQDTGPDSGKITAGGEGDPGARVRIYFDDQQVGEIVVGQDGTWSFEVERKLEPGDHVLRADRVDEKTGTPAGRAQVSMRRVKPAPDVAAAEPVAPADKLGAPAPTVQEDAEAPASPAAPTEDTAQPETPQVAATEPDRSGAAETRQRPEVYAIKRGDTLWDIAEEYLGGGWRYKKIARQNRKVIRNPHWIYPDQEVRLPQR